MLCQTHRCSFDEKYTLEPNPDISGIGVIVGFVTTGWATLLLLTFHYIAGPLKASGESDTLRSDQLDNTLRNMIWNLLRSWTPSPQWGSALEIIVLAMSDQQLVTGLSIIISGYFQLPCSLSFYHWQMITSLAWFSSTTHLATLLFLKQYLRRNRYIWYARVALMTGLAVMLAVGIALTGIWAPEPAMPVRCVFTIVRPKLFPYGEGITMVLSEIILLGGLLIRLLEISSNIRRVSRGSLRAALGSPWRKSLDWSCKKLQQSSRRSQAFFTPLVVFSLTLLISVQAVLDVMVSYICGLLWLLVSLIWGTMRLFYTRRPSEENEWSFGQLVPVLLLLLPVLLIAEGFSDIGFRKRNPSPHNNANDNSEDTSCPSQRMESVIQLQLVPARSFERVNDAILSYNITSDSRPVRTGSPLCARLQCICQDDFRTEPWYLDNLFLLACYAIAESCIVLRWARNGSVWSLDVLLPPIFSLCYLTAIPLCGIVDLIQRSRRSQRHPSFIIRLAVDPAKDYRLSRRIYFLCAPVVVIVYVSVPSLGWNILPAGIWCIAGFIVWVYAIFASVSSVRSQVLS